MTLVLSCLTPTYVLQVSDRRLTRLGSASVVEDDANKAVVLWNRVAFAYTGLARLQGKGTDEWLMEALQPWQSTGHAMQLLAESATAAFAQIRAPRSAKRHAFAAAGWARFEGDVALKPFLTVISNAIDDRGRWKPNADDSFQIRLAVLPDQPGSVLVAPVGQPLHLAEFHWLNRRVRDCVRRKLSPAVAAEFMVMLVRSVALRNPAVGRGLLLNAIPKAATERDEVMALASTPDAETLCFLYLSADDSQTVVYGPSFVMPGGTLLSGFEGRPL